MTSHPAGLWGPDPDKRVKYDGPNVFRGSIFDVFRDKFQTEVDSDVISGADVEQVGFDVSVKFGDSGSHCSRDIRLPHFVKGERD